MLYQFSHMGTSEYIKKEYGENFSFPLHLHQCFELIVLQEGEMTVTVDEKEYELKKDDAVLIFPNQLHSLRSESSKHLLFIFSPKLVQAFTIKNANLRPVNNTLQIDSYFLNKLSQLDESCSTTETKGVLYSLCAIFDKGTDYEAKSSSRENLLLKIFDFVEQNFSKDCDLQTLSAFVGYDYAYLSRYFKKATGISYNTYVNISRLNNACYLLKNTDSSVLECALESGFSSLRTFNRNFKQYYNITPQQYRA